jgi:prohibitin 2
MNGFGAFLFFIGLIGVAACLIGIYAVNKRDQRRYTGYKIGGAVATAIAVIGILMASFFTIPAGHSGVILRFGKVQSTTSDGLHARLPIIDKIVVMSVQTQKYEEAASSATKDLQDVQTTIAINYKLDPAGVGDVYRKLGEKYIEKIAAPAVQEIVKEITAKYLAEDLILKRSDVKTEIAVALTNRLKEWHIMTEIVNITNFEFSSQFTASIEAKVIASQKVLEAENRLRQVEVEARMAEQKAKGEAAAVIANAEGQAESIRIVTEAQVKANEAITKSLSPEVLQYIFYDRLGKDIKVIIVPNGTNIVMPDVSK